MTRAALVVLAWITLVVSADKWLLHRSMHDLRPPRMMLTMRDVLRAPIEPQAPPPIPLDRIEYFP
jgi:hypothetical protein